MLDRLLHSNAGLLTRIALGSAIFVVFAIIDIRRHGPSATRWREYTVLLAAVATALLYGILNDQITSRISWEYFYYAKELDKTLGPDVPPDMTRLHQQAALVGMKATWSAGLISGVALLLANNPFRNLPRFRNRRLLRFLPLIVFTTIACASVFGFAGYQGWLTNLSPDFQDLARANLFRPQHFMCTWGIHLGGYLGGLLGTVLSVALIIRQRREALHQTSEFANRQRFNSKTT